MSTDKNVISTIRLLKSKLLKGLTQHWYIEQKVKTKKHLYFGTDILEYNQETRTISFKKRHMPRKSTGRITTHRTKFASTAPLVLVSSCKPIAGGYEAVIIGCSNCNQSVRNLFKIGQTDIIPQITAGTKATPEKYVCLCTGHNIITTCRPQIIKKDTWLISQIYLNKPLIDFIISLNKNVLKNLNIHFFGATKGPTYNTLFDVMMSYGHQQPLYHFILLVFTMLKDRDSRIQTLLEFFFNVNQFEENKNNREANALANEARLIRDAGINFTTTATTTTTVTGQPTTARHQRNPQIERETLNERIERAQDRDTFNNLLFQEQNDDT